MRRSVLLFAAIGAACQTYEFQPVQPLTFVQTSQTHRVIARGLKPNVLFLVDKSGSMGTPIRNDAACMGCGVGVRCPAACPTRLSEMQAAMSTFLSNPNPVARYAAALFPGEGVCGGSTSLAVPLPPPTMSDDDPTPLVTNAEAIRQKLLALAVNATDPASNVIGGTPTASSLHFAGTIAALNDANDLRTDLVILLTDGAPNCNANNPVNCTNVPLPPADLCYASPCANAYCAAGYLDRDGTVAEVRQLATRKISTIVVGFGADLSTPVAFSTLNALAAAGGFGRTCADGTDGECGVGGRCLVGGICEKQFYSASNATELAAVLAQISDQIGPNPCELKLEESPKDDRLLSVLIDGQAVARGPETWKYEPGKIVFQGLLCERAKRTTTTAPIDVEVRVVNVQ